MSILPNFTIRQLLTFREVMRTNSITQASRALGRTQPAVSSMIANLETQLDMKLFARERGALVPTPEAFYFLEEATDVLERLERTSQTMSEISTLKRGNLRIACYPAGSSFFLPNVLSSFLQNRPNVGADFMVRASQVVEDLIASQEFDIGLAITPKPRGSIKVEPFELECFIALPKNDPLANKSVVEISDLSNYPMATLYDEHALTVSIQNAFNRSGAHLNKRFTVRTFLPTLELVSSGLCAAIVDGVTARTAPAPGVVFKRLKPRITNSIAILIPAHRPMSSLAKSFEVSLRRHLKKVADD